MPLFAPNEPMIDRAQCLSWVMSGSRIASHPLPLFPQQRTFRDAAVTSALCQSRSSSLFSKAVVLARPRLIDRLDVIGGDKLDGVLSTAANKERYECS